jgi:hypothetical protein
LEFVGVPLGVVVVIAIVSVVRMNLAVAPHQAPALHQQERNYDLRL